VSKSNKIIPEFMLDSSIDTCMFLMPLSLKPDYEDIKNSYLEVAVKNLTIKEHFTIPFTIPEVFLTHFKLYKVYKLAK
jgi:hypothetical protein